MKISKLICASAGIAFAAAAHAVVLFSDDFDAENGGAGQLSYGGLSQWTVTDGSVDLIGNGTYDLYPGNGLYLDLDGSSNNAGAIASTAINLTAGQNYTIKFDLAGNARGGSDELSFSFADAAASYTLASNDPWTTYSYTFTASATGAYSIVFDHAGGDNQGIILDNVSVEAVPEPVTMAVLGLGVAAFIRRRRSA